MKTIMSLVVVCIAVFGIGFLVGSGVAYAQQAKRPLSVSDVTANSPEWLLMKGVGYYNFLPDDPNKVQFELNEAFTARDQVVSPQNFKGAASKIDAKAVEFINKLMKNDDIAGYVLAHRRLVIIKYRSADWASLIKFIESTYKGLK